MKETLEEAANNNDKHLLSQVKKPGFSYNVFSFKAGAKWQQEIMYSEEEVLNFTKTIIQQYKFGNTNIEQLDLLKETLQQFKKGQ